MYVYIRMYVCMYEVYLFASLSMYCFRIQEGFEYPKAYHYPSLLEELLENFTGDFHSLIYLNVIHYYLLLSFILLNHSLYHYCYPLSLFNSTCGVSSINTLELSF